jgi:hypothetical protein
MGVQSAHPVRCESHIDLVLQALVAFALISSHSAAEPLLSLETVMSRITVMSHTTTDMQPAYPDNRPAVACPPLVSRLNWHRSARAPTTTFRGSTASSFTLGARQ